MAEVYMAGDFRNGTTFEMDGNVFKVVEFQHVKPGKGAAFVRTKLKNVITGAVLEKTFNPSEKFPGAEIEKRDMQYLYNDGGLYYFMDNETYEQIPLNAEQIGDGLKFLKENNESIDYTVLVSLILILSGGIGNLIDRILKGYVVDFIKFDFINFPIFNVADISITLGIFILVIIIVKQMIQNKNEQARYTSLAERIREFRDSL